jgi:imidazolonepropionase-like amidohydrolase
VSRGVAALALLSALSVRPAAACTAFVDGSLALSGERPSPGTLVIEGPRIVAAGAAAAVPADCERISIPGRVVTPGLIDASSTLGLSEIELEPSTRDVQAEDTDPIHASFRAADGYNPRSVLVAVARAGGVTSAVVVPAGGTVSGQAAWVDLLGDTRAESIVRAPVGLAADVGGPAGSVLGRLRELIEDARFFAEHRAAWDGGQSRTFPWRRADLEALRPVIERRVPLLVTADRAADIEALLGLAQELSVKVAIRGAAEGHLLARALAAAGVPVILDPLVFGPGGFDQLHARPDNAARLHAAGVTVALSTFSGHNLRKLRQAAGNAVREGLPWAAALEAITAAPARIFGMDDRGRLAPGASADLVVWSGDPLETSSRAERVVIRGGAVSLGSRQAKLFERYRRLPRSIPALPLVHAPGPGPDTPAAVP